MEDFRSSVIVGSGSKTTLMQDILVEERRKELEAHYEEQDRFIEKALKEYADSHKISAEDLIRIVGIDGEPMPIEIDKRFVIIDGKSESLPDEWYEPLKEVLCDYWPVISSNGRDVTYISRRQIFEDPYHGVAPSFCVYDTLSFVEDPMLAQANRLKLQEMDREVEPDYVGAHSKGTKLKSTYKRKNMKIAKASRRRNRR